MSGTPNDPRSKNRDAKSKKRDAKAADSRSFSFTNTIQLRQTMEIRLDDEGLFARNFDGHLVRAEDATQSDFDQTVTLTIDGREVTVPKAVPSTDSQGKPLRDSRGAVIPRPTTIYDAASAAFVKRPGQPHPIPTLCHQEHLPPVGVCRVCMVEATEMTRRGPRSKMVPSCVQRVTDGMVVTTVSNGADPEGATRVRDNISTVVELLLADHAPGEHANAQTNQLTAVAERLGINESRFAPPKRDKGDDLSHSTIRVNHDDCILCGRCVRSCNTVKQNNVIGLAQKGYDSHIAFDLDNPMGSSSCVSCGECTINCPTDALTFQPSFIDTQVKRLRDEMELETRNGEIVSADELSLHPLFSGIPHKFIQFSGAAVVRRRLKEGEVLCKEGDYGSTAFIIERGRFEVFLSTARGRVTNQSAGGIRGFFGGIKTVLEAVGGKAHLGDLSGAELAPEGRIFMTPDDLILGEMTCLNQYPRSATVVAAEDSEVLEIKRNVLYMLQRNSASREILDRVYRERSLTSQLKSLPLLAPLEDRIREKVFSALRDRVDLISVDPGQTIFEQGDSADDYYIVRLGFVKVSQTIGGEHRVLNYLAPGTLSVKSV